jgi:hypothetical protein
MDGKLEVEEKEVAVGRFVPQYTPYAGVKIRYFPA